uniref:Uncharacterized protein n=1 Tax=Guillardia theta TaxID=55529 RepID=A0A7S4PPL4_GUITH|mmetsp:Transcript_8628/g.28780  ORF Transcript_8628/g.28780 Transcript_8628/m.28780 type:complete len:137 (+) Transcript_8628:77-487(+)
MGSDNRDKVDFLSKSSLPLQILIFFNGCYSTLFFLVTLALLIWKGVEFPYPAGRLPWEIILLFVYIVVEACRLFIGSKGNKTENWPMILMLIVRRHDDTCTSLREDDRFHCRSCPASARWQMYSTSIFKPMFFAWT